MIQTEKDVEELAKKLGTTKEIIQEIIKEINSNDEAAIESHFSNKYKKNVQKSKNKEPYYGR